MTQNIKILGISGSLRKRSLNTRLLQIASGVLPENVSLEIADLSAIPFYDGDVEKQGLPQSVLDFRKKIFEADAILFASPEYNSSFTGVLKNALDWASRPPKDEPYKMPPTAGKPYAIIGVGGRYGTSRGQSHLRQVLQKMDMPGVNQPEVLVQNQPVPVFDQDLNLTDPVAVQLIQLLLQNLVKLIGQTRLA
jgi:chromate reductase